MTKLRADYTFRKSNLSIYYTLYNNADYFDVDYKVNWQEKHTVLKLKVNASTKGITASSPFSSEERGTADIDKPMGEWITAKTDNGNISIVANKVFSYTADNGGISLSLARSCIYGDLRIAELDKNADYPYMCQGETQGNLRVCFDQEFESIANHGIEFNNPPIIIIEANHNGKMPSKKSFALVSGKVVVSALKRAEDRRGIVVRLYECFGKAQNVKLSLFDKEFDFTVNPYEIKTLLIKGKTIKEILITEL
jgi:alpha-mannosidase